MSETFDIPVVLGNITILLNKIKPAIDQETETKTERNVNNKSFLKNVTVNNVFITVKKIKEQSSILKERSKQSK